MSSAEGTSNVMPIAQRTAPLFLLSIMIGSHSCRSTTLRIMPYCFSPMPSYGGYEPSRLTYCITAIGTFIREARHIYDYARFDQIACRLCKSWFSNKSTTARLINSADPDSQFDSSYVQGCELLCMCSTWRYHYSYLLHNHKELLGYTTLYTVYTHIILIRT